MNRLLNILGILAVVAVIAMLAVSYVRDGRCRDAGGVPVSNACLRPEAVIAAPGLSLEVPKP